MSQDLTKPEMDIEVLKQRADILGITYHPNIGAETLLARIKEVQESPEKPTQDVSEKERRSRKARESRSLVRVLIHCNDPNKREWPGEMISVSNALIGTIKRYIPYGSENPTHIERALFNTLAEKRIQVFTQKPGKHGIPQPKARTIPAYTLTVMPQLTEEEIATLARSQAVRGATLDD